MLGATFARFLALRREERAQVGIEWLLATGAMTVVFAALLIGLYEAFVPWALRSICSIVDPLGDGTNCITII